MKIGRSNHAATVFNDNIIVMVRLREINFEIENNFAIFFVKIVLKLKQGGFEGIGIIRDTEVFNDDSGTWTRYTKVGYSHISKCNKITSNVSLSMTISFLFVDEVQEIRFDSNYCGISTNFQPIQVSPT